MLIDNKVDYLKKNIMFKDTSLEELKSIADISEVVDFADNQTIKLATKEMQYILSLMDK